MTIEDAILILDPKTTVQELAKIEYYAGFNGKKAKTKAVDDACNIAVEVMKERQERNKNNKVQNCNYLEGK